MSLRRDKFRLSIRRHAVQDEPMVRQRAAALFESGDFQGCIDLLKQAQLRNHTSIQVLFDIAVAYRRKGKYRRALECMNRLDKLRWSKDCELAIPELRGDILFAQGRLVPALRVFEHALTMPRPTRLRIESLALRILILDQLGRDWKAYQASISALAEFSESEVLQNLRSLHSRVGEYS